SIVVAIVYIPAYLVSPFCHIVRLHFALLLGSESLLSISSRLAVRQVVRWTERAGMTSTAGPANAMPAAMAIKTFFTTPPQSWSTLTGIPVPLGNRSCHEMTPASMASGVHADAGGQAPLLFRTIRPGSDDR